jgi:hypothetical protein
MHNVIYGIRSVKFDVTNDTSSLIIIVKISFEAMLDSNMGCRFIPFPSLDTNFYVVLDICISLFTLDPFIRMLMNVANYVFVIIHFWPSMRLLRNYSLVVDH